MPEALEGFRLSPQQERLWAVAQADRDWPLFVWGLFEVEGKLEDRPLKAAIETLVAHQEILRTEILPGPDREPVQTIGDRLSFRFHSLEAEAAELEALVESAPHKAPAHPGTADLAVWHLRRADGSSLLVLRASAFASDRQGLRNLARALLQAYAACRDGRALLEEPIQYIDVAEAFRRLLESVETRAGREYWHSRWPADPLAFRLPVEPPSQVPDGGDFLLSVRSVLSDTLTAHLYERARLQKDSTETLVLACWLTALHGATGVLDLCVGVLTEGRDFEGLTGALGPFSRCLPLRVQVRPRSGFGDLVHSTGQELVQGRRFQDYFAAESNSFLPWMFESFSCVGIVEGDLGLRLQREQSTVDRFHLMLSLARSGERLELMLTWDARVYEREVVEELFAGLKEVLEHCVPSVSVGDLCLVAKVKTGSSESLLKPLRTEAVARPPIERADRSVPLPLSFAQQRLWFLHQLEPDSAAYNMPQAVGLTGDLDLAALAGSLGEVVRRHEVLRTVFEAVDGEPWQVIRPASSLPLRLVDLSGLEAGVSRAEVERLAVAEADRPFDLSQGPLLRFTVLRLGSRKHVLLTTMHHIVSDGWSMGIFSSEVMALYRAAQAGQASPLAELRVQYADFAVWQRSWLQGEVLEAELDYWRRQLRGVPPVLALPTDRPRPPVAGSRGASRSWRVEEELTGALGALAASQGATLFMVLLAGFASLLHRLTGETDLVVGTPIANRNHLETEGLIGFFVNTLALRCDLSEAPGFLAVLERIRAAALAAYAHQDVPFERLVAELAPERSLSYTPLFQVMLSLQNTPREAVDSGDLSIAPVQAGAVLAKFDLDLGMSQVEGRLVAVLVHRSDLFDPATAARFLGYFERLLAAGVSTPWTRISDLPMLSTAERWQMLGEWCDTDTQVPSDLLLHQLFEAQVRRVPDGVAVVHEGEFLSYRSLNLRANRLARRLRELGVGVDGRVGICAERSFELVVGLLAILKVGAAYLPLDPDYPADRLAFLAEEGLGTDGVVLSKGSLPHGLERLSGLRQVPLSIEGPEPEGVEGEDLALPVPAEAAAYILYTSGSTGRPKGVVNCHRGIVNRILWAAVEILGPKPEDRYLQKAPINFDVSVIEIFGPLTVGAPVVLAWPGGHRDPAYLTEVVEREGITMIGFVPSLLQVFLDEDVKGCGSLRLVLSGGEALPFELEQRSLRQFGCTMYNQYGPTEAAVDVTAWRCRPSERERPVPIGRPMANTRLYVLDANGSPVPLGVLGELYLGGVQLARGYLGRPDLTAERFVPDSFSSQPGGRLYRTGDLVRWSPVGDIEHLGRADHQVKVRGVRIELGEIEAVLQAHPDVREAVVVPHGAGSNVRLVAYVVGREGHPIVTSRLRDHLRASLTEPMVPSSFVSLTALPLTPSGKADRRALPAPEPVRETAGELVRPRGPVEDLVAGIWSEVLGLEEVGPDESFFDLGGHSLLAVRVISRTKSMLGVDLPLRVLFEEPTLAGFTERVDLALRRGGTVAGRLIERADRPLVPIWARGPRPPFFCVHPIGGNVFCYLDLSRSLGADQPFYGLQAPPASEGPWCVENLAARYVEAVREVQPRGPYFLGGWSMGGTIAFDMARRLTAEGEQVSVLALIDSNVGPSRSEAAAEEPLGKTFARDMASLMGLEPDDAVGEGPESEEVMLAGLLAEGQRRGVFPVGLSFADVRDVFLIFKYNHQALQSHVAGPYGGRAELFRAESGLAGSGADPTAGWGGLAAGGVGIQVVPGNHYSMLRAPNVASLASRLRAVLEVATTESVGGKQ